MQNIGNPWWGSQMPPYTGAAAPGVALFPQQVLGSRPKCVTSEAQGDAKTGSGCIVNPKYRILAIAAITIVLAGIIVGIICAIVFTTNNTGNTGPNAVIYNPNLGGGDDGDDTGGDDIGGFDFFARGSSSLKNTTTSVLFEERKEWIPMWEAAKQRASESSYRGIPVDYLAAVILYTDSQIPFAEELNQSIRKGTLLDSRTLLALYRLLARGLKLMKEADPRCYQSVYVELDGSITAELGKSVCLGQFHIASLDKPTVPLQEDQSLLVFDTCYGVSLQNISTSSLPAVLIPPYERFRITKIDGRTHYLNSTGQCSASTCAARTGETSPCPVLQ